VNDIDNVPSAMLLLHAYCRHASFYRKLLAFILMLKVNVAFQKSMSR
jgi:hypothetical protein